MKSVKTDGVQHKGAHLGSASALSSNQAQTEEILRAYVELAFSGDPLKDTVLAILGIQERSAQ